MVAISTRTVPRYTQSMHCARTVARAPSFKQRGSHVKAEKSKDATPGVAWTRALLVQRP